MIQYVDELLVPWFNNRKETLKLPKDQKSLLILDVFAAHRTADFLSKLEANNICCCYVPAGCTGQLQPLDVALNDELKKLLTAEFTTWYASEITKELKSGKSVQDININLTTTRIKGIHANWMMSAINKLSQKHDLIRAAFTRAGIKLAQPDQLPSSESGMYTSSSVNRDDFF